MAFGFGFNKQKVLSAAEKFVQQGKSQNAITEYEKILKNDPKDLTVMNTIGDLYARIGQNEKAVGCFRSVGDAYASQGFTVKAIAMYKKLSKLKPTLEGVLRLAELYTQQGLFNDARAQYLQVAEQFLRTGELEQAVRIFQKTLEMDPENVAMKMRLAEVYVRLGKKTEAWQIFATAAESLRGRGSLDAAEEILQRMLTLDPGNSYALLLRGRNALEAGDASAAIKHLEKVADLDSHPDGMRALLQAYLQTGRLPDAGVLATKLFTVHNDGSAITSFTDVLLGAGHFDDALKIFSQYADRLLAVDSAKVLESLHTIIGHVPENTAALEMLLALFHKAGENSHVAEVYELLAHAYANAGELEKARDCYLKLTQVEPHNQLHTHNYQQVVARLGGTSGSRLITAEEGAVSVDELEATAPPIDQRYSDDVALAVRTALTDAELFVSYNMPAKALGPLLSVLPKAPRDVRLNQRLVALHTRAGRFAEAAVCCRALQSVYHDAGYSDEATRYGGLADRHEECVCAGMAGSVEAESVPSASAAAAPPVVTPPAPGLFWHAPVAPSQPKAEETAEFGMPSAPLAPQGEIDLSEEWEDALAGETSATPIHPDEAAAAVVGTGLGAQDERGGVEETIEEIRFYLAHSMGERARSAMAQLEQLTHDAAKLSAVREEIELAAAQAPSEAAQEASVEEVEAVPEAEATPPTLSKAGALDEFVADLDSSLAEGFPPEAPTLVPQSEPEPESAPCAETAVEPKHGVLGEFVADLESSLRERFPAGARRPEAQPEPALEPVSAESAVAMAAGAAGASVSAVPASVGSTAAAPSSPASLTYTYQHTPIRPLPAAEAKFSGGGGVDLAEMFGELKQDLEGEGATETQEDPETHYNLGVAFREMGLLDEAIAELQKVCHAVDRGHPFPQIMQAYTWLAQCFLDKSVPEAAIRWYERALKLSDIDEDTRTALHYELASAYETAQNRTAALNHFMEVYGSNIDYRDVAERIKALKS